jgi:cysteine desulfuration protein SufE
MNLEELQNEIVDEFSIFDEWMDRYGYLIDLGKTLEPLDPSLKTEDHLIKGCQSQVWVVPQMQDGNIVFAADSDAAITKGIIALLVRVLSGRTPEEIANANLHFIDDIGLKENLSPTRSNGLVAMIKQMKDYARAHQAQ